VPFTDPAAQRRLALAAALLALTACAQRGPAPAPAPPPAPAPVQPSAAPPAVVAPAPAAAARAPLAAPATPRNKDDLRRQAARRMVAASPDASYTGKPQDILLAIPVLEIELNADGSVKNVRVLREPSQAKDTTRLAVDAVRRAAPYGDVSRLPKPWTFVETFLFNDERKFKPRTLEE
jgi:outer membrane biosynthesis protein TonB